MINLYFPIKTFGKRLQTYENRDLFAEDTKPETKVASEIRFYRILIDLIVYDASARIIVIVKYWDLVRNINQIKEFTQQAKRIFLKKISYSHKK